MKVELRYEAIEVVLAALEIAKGCVPSPESKKWTQIVIDDIKNQCKNQIAFDLSENKGFVLREGWGRN